MCGITGYIGKRSGLHVAFNNLKKLEYRGYDSAGIAYFNFPKKGKSTPSISEGLYHVCPQLVIQKKPGKLAVLEREMIGVQSLAQTAVIAHTRWATHGAPNEMNAHPHIDCAGKIAVVHNGIIENYHELKEKLQKKGHHFISETDTEVVAHSIEDALKTEKNFQKAFEKALRSLRGAYALAVVSRDEPHAIYFARLGSPLVLGVGDGEYFLASDPTALAGIVKKVVYIKDGARGKIDLQGFAITPGKPKMETLDITAEQAQKGNFAHFMLKEIMEAPEVMRAAMAGRLLEKGKGVKLGGLTNVEKKLAHTKRFEIIACGTSYYAGLVGKRLFEEIVGIPTDVWLASEYRYAKIPKQKGTTSLFISQSGETADTLAALRKAKESKYLVLGIVNIVGSTIARETEAGVYNHAGPEISVASTKAFISQLTVLTMMACFLKGEKNKEVQRLLKELVEIPKKIKKVLHETEKIKAIAAKYVSAKNVMYIGRGYNVAMALEGALKLKEISYVHAEGCAAGEFKHGSIALIDHETPTVVFANENILYEKIISNIQEVKARGGPIIAIGTVGDTRIKKIADDVIEVPKTIPEFEPFLNVVVAQLFAYHAAVLRGCNVDQPRNLAKSVTVE